MGVEVGDGLKWDPRSEYERRLQDRRRDWDKLNRLQETAANARLGVFVLGLVMLWLIFGSPAWSIYWLIPVVVGFAALLTWSERVKRNAGRAERSVAFYERGLARIDDQWDEDGETGKRFQDLKHPYSPDLDLFGDGSLYQLLCSARTRIGEEFLASWLRSPATLDEIRERQEAIQELRPMIDLREELALRGENVREGIDPDALVQWGAQPAVLTTQWPRVVAALLSLVLIGALIGWYRGDFGGTPALVIGMIMFGLWWMLAERIEQVIGTVRKRAHDLGLLAELLEQVETREFQSPRLKKLRETLWSDGDRPSRRIRALSRLVYFLDQMQNQVFVIFALILLWPIQFAYLIDAWKRKSGSGIRGWLEAAGELEAFCSLAAYSYENPDDPFPEVVDGSEGPVFDGERIGHPLLAKAVAVRNDVRFLDGLRLFVVSGSNMSGKSTLLRSLGVNVVLALAGAPVRARRLRISPLAIGGTLRVEDSLKDGKSRFYAEITRVRQLVEISRGELPLFFLLDEIFSGTNSHERCIGAEGVVKGLIDRGSIGLMTTHDLTLAQLGDTMGPRARNVHFEDQFENGELSFDYQMRPGVVQKSNALALMRAVGLDV